MKKIILFLILFCGSWILECEGVEKEAEEESYHIGYILSVHDEHGFAVINLGSEDGVRKKEKFYVFRGNKEIGVISAFRVRQKIAACDIEKLNYASVLMPYDLVIGNIDPLEELNQLTKKLILAEEERKIFIGDLGEMEEEKKELRRDFEKKQKAAEEEKKELIGNLKKKEKEKTELIKDVEKLKEEKGKLISEFEQAEIMQQNELEEEVVRLNAIREELIKEREEKEKIKEEIFSTIEKERELLKKRLESIDKMKEDVSAKLEGVRESETEQEADSSDGENDEERRRSIEEVMDELLLQQARPSEIYIEIDASVRLIYLASIQALKEEGYLITTVRKKTGNITARKFLKKRGLVGFLRGFVGAGRSEDEVVLKFRRDGSALMISVTMFSRREGRIRRKKVARDSRIHKEVSRIAQRIRDVAENS